MSPPCRSAVLFVLCGLSASAPAAVHLVGPSRTAPYNTLAGAVGAAGTVNGDTLLLDAATHNLTAALTINKSLTIQGQGIGTTVVENTYVPGGTASIVTVSAANVRFEDITFRLGGNVTSFSQGYMFRPTAAGTVFEDVQFDGKYARSVIVPSSTGGNITVNRCLFTGYIGQEAIRESGANWVITHNRFEYYTYNWGPILWEDAWPLSGTVAFNYFGNRVGFYDGANGTGSPVGGAFSATDGAESFLRINSPSQVSTAGLLIAHNTFDFRDFTRVNSSGIAPNPQAIFIDPLSTPGGPITIRDNVFSGYRFNASTAEPVWRPGQGVFGGALEFNGQTAHATFQSPGFDVGTAGTMSVWVKMANVGKRNQIVEGPGDAGLEFQFRTNSGGQFYGRTTTVGGDFVIQNGSAGAGALNTWVCLQYVWDFAATSKMQIFINGTEVGYLATFTPTDLTWAAPVDTKNGLMYVGRDPGDSSRMFQGQMDDLAFFNRALNATERDAVRTSGAGTAASGNSAIQSAMVAYWALDNSSGLVAAGDGGTTIPLTLAAGAPTTAVQVPATNITLTNNLFFNNDQNANVTLDGTHRFSDPAFAATGSTTPDYYALGETSPARGFASNGRSIGAWQPDDVFVTESGNDAVNFGTQSSPYASVQRGANAVDDNGRVHLSGTFAAGASLPRNMVVQSSAGNAATAVIAGAGSGTALDVAAGVTSVTLSRVTLDNHTTGVAVPSGAATVTVFDSIISRTATGLSTAAGNTLNLLRSRVGPNTAAHVQASGQFAGLNINGNEFVGPNVYFSNAIYASPLPSVGPNWFSDTFSEDKTDTTPNNGFIDGLIKTISAGGSVQSLNTGLVTAQLDRDGDGLSDAWELFNGTTLFNNYASPASGGRPDGVPAAGFSLSADTDGDGFVDWYERNRRQRTDLLAARPSLADVFVDGRVDLADAVRTLQIVNDTLPMTLNNGDVNAMNVTGGQPRLLNNALQILRFQAGSRASLPAKPGIN